jgi:hypothetical protein
LAAAREAGVTTGRAVGCRAAVITTAEHRRRHVEPPEDTMHRTPLIAAALLALAAAAQAQTFNFQQGSGGYVGQLDTQLSGADPDAVLGNEPEVSIDASDGGFPSQALLRFEGLFGSGAGQIAADSVITAATLTLNITSAGSGLRLHEMLLPWGNTSTWNGFGNGLQADGIEVTSTPLLTLGADDSGANIEEGLLVIDVTAALRRAQAGFAPHGWALLPWLPNGTNGLDFYSAEWVTVAERPLLTVQATPVPEPASALLTALGAAAVLAARRRRA